MSLEKTYPKLYHFIGGWFPDADFDELSDKDIVNQFCSAQNPEDTAEVIGEAEHLLIHGGKFLGELEELANIFFEDIGEAENWLVKIIGYLKQKGES